MRQGSGRITTVEMHTGGEPVRIVTGGWPPIEGRTILDKRRFVRAEQDRWRRVLMAEPRGHADMYGALLVEPDLPEADLAVLFLHNEGWSTMCGHAVIALGRYAVDRGLVPVQEPETLVRIQCPCGLVTAKVTVTNGRAGRVRFESVPAFAYARDAVVLADPFGPVGMDIGYGGAFYGILPAAEIGLDLEASPLGRIVEAALALKRAAAEQIPLSHPGEPDLAFLYGIILTDGFDGGGGRPSANICVFADGQIDRSPTGSGVTARMAVMHRRRQVGLGEPRRFRSITGAEFTAAVLAETRAGPHPAVTVEVGGEAFYTGEAGYWVEPEDPLGEGFLLRR
ncbi:proline racemase family protein [Benzoatithermus flavus]|uniref:Proline racemase family protein n=1 Tax=Benzoatithermus flavus TaxID=3108223 RepID=A0ABU8XM83_9PROT